jgi:hypothetical protein
LTAEVNQQELVQYIANRTKIDPKRIQLVLKHEQAFMSGAKANAKGEVDIDGDELVDYVLSRSDVKLDELKVEAILDAEMDYLIEQGLADYDD